jgi:TetR/AcrR family transcriptional repressor of uid operon
MSSQGCRRRILVLGKDGRMAQGPQAASGQESLAERILDAASTVVARHGLRRTSMEEVARIARCSRPTAYKHYGSRDKLLAAVFVREVDRYLEGLPPPAAVALGPAGPLEETFVHTLRHVRGHPLVKAVVAADPKGLTELLALDDGRVLQKITTGLSRHMGEMAAAGALRPGLPVEVATEAFVRIVLSFLLFPRLLVDPDDEEAVRSIFRASLSEGTRPA